ncbi:permease of the major facilitator superfamily [Serinicoccus hydrothermalis]|uniref:Permease of the major facilitator superfamily n=1 Tax=Serinicoccus hydrothermalis TaxID=1758689 RepID=A0A1B1NC11_9MICO|nr:MFS transporter [Serinicoccus hydrothermalis]ANS78962.1 permease of the major facilitator superfamily [Serinicoccus hydrothermalis]
MSAPTAERVRIPSEIWILVGASFVIAVGFGLVSPVLPGFARSFDVGATAATIVVSAFAFCRLVFAPAGGRLVQRLGERPVYLTGLMVVAVSSLATAFAQSYWQLLVFRGLGGLGSTMFTISAIALVVGLAPPGIRGRVSSLWGSSFIIGSMVGPVIGGLIAQWGMRVPFVVYAVALVVAALVVAVGLGGARLRPPPGEADRPVLTVREALGEKAYRAALACGVANGWANLGVRMAVIPLLAAAVRDETWVAGATLTTAALGTAITLQVTGRLADRVGRRPLIIAGMVTSGVSLGMLGLSLLPGLGAASSLAVLLGLSLVSGVGAGFVNPAQQAAIADIVGQERNGGTVLSTYQMATDSGVIVGPVLTGLVVDLVGFGPALATTGAVSLLGALIWLRAPETLAPATQPPTAASTP